MWILNPPVLNQNDTACADSIIKTTVPDLDKKPEYTWFVDSIIQVNVTDINKNP